MKNIGETENHARYVMRGRIAKMWPSEKGRDYRVKVFGPGSIASDLGSFMNQIPTGFSIKTLTYVSVIELNKSEEEEIIKKIPELGGLAAYINRQVLAESLLWQNILASPVNEGILMMKKHYPAEMNYLTNKDKAFIFKTSVNTITKIIASID